MPPKKQAKKKSSPKKRAKPGHGTINPTEIVYHAEPMHIISNRVRYSGPVLHPSEYSNIMKSYVDAGPVKMQRDGYPKYKSEQKDFSNVTKPLKEEIIFKTHNIPMAPEYKPIKNVYVRGPKQDVGPKDLGKLKPELKTNEDLDYYMYRLDNYKSYKELVDDAIQVSAELLREIGVKVSNNYGIDDKFPSKQQIIDDCKKIVKYAQEVYEKTKGKILYSDDGYLFSGTKVVSYYKYPCCPDKKVRLEVTDKYRDESNMHQITLESIQVCKDPEESGTELL